MRLLSTITLLFFLGAMGLQAQTEVASVPQIGLGMALGGDDLYVSSGAKIYKVDLTAEKPEATEILKDLNYMISLVVHGTDLYMGNFDKIFKVDLTATTLEATEVVSGLRYVRGFLIDGNDLYFTQQNGSKVSKIDITATTPTVVDIVSGVSSATGLAKIGDTLYVTRYGVRKISKIDVTANPIVAVDFHTTTEAPSGIISAGNYIYYSEFDGDESGRGKITRLDATGASVDAKVLVSGFDAAWDMVVYGCNILYGDQGQRKIMEISGLEAALNLSTNTDWKTITSNQMGASYQWINCADNSPIVDETSQSFTASENGEYAVVVTVGECSDTSECVNILSVGANETSTSKAVSMYPNPSEGIVNLDFGRLDDVVLRVFDTRGQLVFSEQNINASPYQFELNDVSPGIYIVELQANGVWEQHKLILE